MNAITCLPALAREFAMGFCLGCANIIPGVSGGTFLLIFGIYERVFAILNQITPAFFVRSARLGKSLVLGRKGSATAFFDFLKQTDFIFLIKLGLGAGVAIVALSGLMKYLLLHHFVLTYAFFLGLILVSVALPVKLLRRVTLSVVFCLLLGVGLTISVTLFVNPYDRVKLKSDHVAAQYGETRVSSDPAAGAGEPHALAWSGRYRLNDYLYIGLCGAVAVSAMVLPGISGSLVLILMGAYFDVISAITGLSALGLDSLVFLGAFAMGMGLGGLLFARLVSYVFDRYYNATMGFLTGLMAGSLYALWPFKQAVVMPRQFLLQEGGIRILENVTVYTNVNLLPTSADPVGWALVSFLVGCALMAGFIRTES